ncbi:hypothetical protein QI155_10785 [Thermodesulfovibrio sp. 1176]|uniref:hypothetical protein n=1 Tax=Thermodesulfovibrio sp. 1176 TaxID=3043424 RepID=UPI0024830E97|nr:hypothetical protein [Thermodesulfovibrio sp. 1176]MDI1473017.1 hypothetical protein [Thermodesulfovibrio sp. 1176]
MGKVIIDRKDEKFIVSITPYLENTFVIDEVEISEEAENALFGRKGSDSAVKKFAEEWREKVFKEF